MTLTTRLIAEMGNHGFRVVDELSPQGLTFEGMGSKKRVTVPLPKDKPEDETAAMRALVSEALAAAAAQGTRVTPRG